MSPSKGHGHGLRPEDVDFLFPDSPAGSPDPPRPDPSTPIDFKRRASGEREDLEPENPDVEDSQPWPETEEADAPKPNLSEEPWPEPPEETPVEESPDLQSQAVREQSPQIAVQAPVRAGRRRLPPLPSDRQWRGELQRIFGKGGNP